MVGYIFKAFKVMGVVGEWAEKSLADGKLTRKEKLAMADTICEILGIIEKEESDDNETNP